MENIDSHKFVPEISLCVAKAQYCSAFCDAIPLGVIWLILQLSGSCDLDVDLGSGSWSYRCASLIKYYLDIKFDKDCINFKK